MFGKLQMLVRFEILHCSFAADSFKSCYRTSAAVLIRGCIGVSQDLAFMKVKTIGTMVCCHFWKEKSRRSLHKSVSFGWNPKGRE